MYLVVTLIVIPFFTGIAAGHAYSRYARKQRLDREIDDLYRSHKLGGKDE